MGCLCSRLRKTTPFMQSLNPFEGLTQQDLEELDAILRGGKMASPAPSPATSQAPLAPLAIRPPPASPSRETCVYCDETKMCAWQRSDEGEAICSNCFQENPERAKAKRSRTAPSPRKLDFSNAKSFGITPREILNLQQSARRRAMANRQLDLDAQRKFWLEVLPTMLTPELFTRVYANYKSEHGHFVANFNVRDAIDASGPPKTEDVTAVKPAGVEVEIDDYDIELVWYPVKTIRDDFFYGPPYRRVRNCERLPKFYRDNFTQIVTDVFALYFPFGMGLNLIEQIHPRVKEEAHELFSRSGFDLFFPDTPNATDAVYFIVKEDRKNQMQWEEYWSSPFAGREVFTVEMKASTSGDPDMGKPGYDGALARPATRLPRSIAEEEAEANQAALRRSRSQSVIEGSNAAGGGGGGGH